MFTRVILPALAATTLLASTRTASARSHTSLSDVVSCVPTAQGVWVGSGGGLARVSYTGSVAGRWTAHDGLPGTRVNAVVPRGSKLIVGAEAGVAVVEPRGARLVVRQRITGANVRALVVHKGAIYAGTWGRGVVRVDLVAGKLVPVPFAGGRALFRKRVTSLIVHRNHLLAATAGSGVFKLTGNGILSPLASVDRKALVWALQSTPDALWWAGVDGLYRVTAAGSRKLYAGDTRGLSRYRKQLWLASFGGGVRRVAAKRTRPAKGLAAVFAQTVRVNSHGACAGGKRGLWVHSNDKPRWRAANLGGLPANDISAIATDGPRLWIGMFDHGVAVMDRRGAVRAVGAGVIGRHVNAIAVVRPGTSRAVVWVATANGLYRIRGKHIATYKVGDGLPSRMVFSVVTLRSGGIAAATPRGAVIIRGHRRPIVIGSKRAVLGNVWAVAEDVAGYLWLGTTRGVYRGKPGTKHWQRYTVSTGHLKDDWVTAIATERHTVWVGTYNRGVTRFDLHGRTATATQLGGGWINPNGLRVANGRVFAATMDGPKEHNGITWLSPVKRPLGKDTTSVLPTRRGLWVAGRRGLMLQPGYKVRPALSMPRIPRLPML